MTNENITRRATAAFLASGMPRHHLTIKNAATAPEMALASILEVGE